MTLAILVRTASVLLVGLALLGACGSDDQSLGSVSNGASAGKAGGGGSGGGSGGGINFDGSTPSVTALKIEPSTATIDVTNGSSSPVTYKAIATLASGSTQEVTADWTFDRADLGTITKGGGLLTAQGTKGGKGTVNASYGGVTAQAEAIVKLHLEDNPAGLGAAQKSAFGSPDATPSGTLLYPYDGTVFGRGILAPEVMWNGGDAGDVYLIQIVDPYVDLTTYVSVDPPSRWTMAADWWTKLTESSDGATPVSVKIERMNGAGQAHAPMTESWKIAPGNLRGTITYWAVSKGAIVKINPGASSPVPAFEPGPYDQLGAPAPVSGYDGTQPPWANQGAGKRCVACHTVSRDGSTLAAAFHAGAAYPWGVVDTASTSVSLISDYKNPSIFTALTPNGKRIVSDFPTLTLGLADTATGKPMASLLDGLTKVCHPQFSPDGKLLAFAANVGGGSPFEFSSSDLDVVDYDDSTSAFQNPRTVLAGGGTAIAWPSFTPDSKWIVYQRGDYSRANYGTNNAQVGHDELYMASVPASGLGTEIKLSAASGSGTLPPKELQRSYQPRVNPVAVGGYFWVVFVSPRDYGNRMASTQNASAENRKQLWVTAVDANPQPGTDPSHPAFWLPGQDIATINMDGYWSLEPCKQEGNDCNEGYECCTGFCRDQGDGTFKCVPPPTGCSNKGETCKNDADCCDAPKVKCIGGVCAQPSPS